MPRSNFGYIGAGGVAGLQQGLQELLAARIAQQELDKLEKLAREKAWTEGLASQRDYGLRQAQLGISQGQLTLAQQREAREAAEAAKPPAPKYRMITGIQQADGSGGRTMIVPDDQPGSYDEYEPPEKPAKPSAGFGEAYARYEARLGRPATQAEENQFFREYSLANDPVRAPAGPPKPPTGAQYRALNFYNRMQDALPAIEENEAQLTDWDRAKISGVSPNGWGELLVYPTLSPAAKSYVRAMKQFTEARLRKDSGAAVPAAEYTSDLRTFGAQVGDTPESLAERRRARQEVAEGIAFESGRAYEDFYGDAFQRGQHTTPRPPAAAPGAAPRRRTTLTPEDLAGSGRSPALPPTPEAAGAAPAPRRRRLTFGPNGLQESPR